MLGGAGAAAARCAGGLHRRGGRRGAACASVTPLTALSGSARRCGRCGRRRRAGSFRSSRKRGRRGGAGRGGSRERGGRRRSATPPRPEPSLRCRSSAFVPAAADPSELLQTTVAKNSTATAAAARLSTQSATPAIRSACTDSATKNGRGRSNRRQRSRMAACHPRVAQHRAARLTPLEVALHHGRVPQWRARHPGMRHIWAST